MKALVKSRRGPGNVKLKEVEQPRIKSEEVLIEVKFSGICGTDLHILNDQTFYTPPVTLGHEYSGIIVKKGFKVSNLDVGDRVTSPATIPCGECLMCKTNHENRCVSEKKRILGTHKANGTFAKYVAIPARILHKIPEKLSLEEASVAELASCVVHAVFERISIKPNDIVAVLGPGPMGLLTVQAVNLAGAKQIIVTGISADKERLELAKKFGASHIINVDDCNLVEIIRNLTDGLGVDIVFEASGSSAARQQAYNIVRRCGKVGLIGLTGRESQINLDQVVFGELDVKGSWGTIWSSWRTALYLLSEKKMQTSSLINKKLPLEEWNEGFELVEKCEVIKALLVP